MCLEDDDCTDRCDLLTQQAQAPVRPPVFQSSLCELAVVIDGDPTEVQPAASCLCVENDTNGALLLSPTGPDKCMVYGRDRTCLYERDSFPGCDLNVPQSSCQNVCAEVQRRLEVDAIREPRVEVRRAGCEESGCHCVFDINNTCYVDDWLDAYPCDQSDEEIMEQFETLLD